MLSFIEQQFYYDSYKLCDMKNIVDSNDKFIFTINDSLQIELLKVDCSESDIKILSAFAAQFIEHQTDYQTHLEKAKTVKILELNNDCTKNILNGFPSKSFDGITERIYDFGVQDQMNMTSIFALIQLGVPIYWKAQDEQISYEWTIQQFQQLCIDSYTAKLTKMRFFHELRYMVNQATSIEEVNEIHW